MTEIYKCPKCGCTASHKSGSEQRKHALTIRRKCKYCGCKFTINKKINNNPICKYCGSTKVYKAGKTKDGVQVYHCAECEKTYRSETIKTRLTLKDKENILKWHIGGFSTKFIAEYLGFGETTVRRIKTQYKSGELKADTSKMIGRTERTKRSYYRDSNYDI